MDFVNLCNNNISEGGIAKLQAALEARGANVVEESDSKIAHSGDSTSFTNDGMANSPPASPPVAVKDLQKMLSAAEKDLARAQACVVGAADKAAAEAIQLPKNFADVSFLRENHSNFKD